VRRRADRVADRGRPDLHGAYAGITLPNDASVKLHQKLGFRQIGVFEEVGRKFDKYWSVAWFEKRI
jgi:phosphinothricin acetyltransferase